MLAERRSVRPGKADAEVPAGALDAVASGGRLLTLRAPFFRY